MSLFSRRDKGFPENVRKEGFERYKQLLSFYAFRWLRINLLTTAGFLPLISGIAYAILSSSLIVLFPASIIGGMIAGPFLAGMFDSIMRGLRDAPGKLWEHYKKSWKNNLRQSLLPGAILGLMCGLSAFMAYMIWVSQSFPGWLTIILLLFSVLLFLLFSTLYWPQLVLFSQKGGLRIKNAVLFALQNFWRTLGCALLELFYILFYVLFAPWTLILIPFIGFWLIIFLTQFFIYNYMDEAFNIEEQYREIEGDPWRVSPLDKVPKE